MNGSLLNVFKAIILTFILLPFNSNIDINACWDSDDSEAIDNIMEDWDGTDYEWGSGHSWDEFDLWGLDSVLNDGFDCTGMYNVGMWKLYGETWDDQDGNYTGDVCEDPYLTEYNPNNRNFWEGDVIISSSGGHEGYIDSVREDGLNNVQHAAGNEDGGWHDEVVTDTAIDPWDDSRWGYNEGATYKGLTPP